MADVLTVPDGHPTLVAQRCINTILAGRVSALPIYKNGEHASREVLADIQALARWIITAVDHEGLGHHLPGDMLSALKAHRKVLDWPYGMYWNSVAVVPNVIDAAVGITVATSILGQSTNSIAAVAFRRLMTHAAKRRPYSLPLSNRSISRVLTLIQSAALRTTTPPPDSPPEGQPRAAAALQRTRSDAEAELTHDGTNFAQMRAQLETEFADSCGIVDSTLNLASCLSVLDLSLLLQTRRLHGQTSVVHPVARWFA